MKPRSEETRVLSPEADTCVLPTPLVPCGRVTASVFIHSASFAPMKNYLRDSVSFRGAKSHFAHRFIKENDNRKGWKGHNVTAR